MGLDITYMAEEDKLSFRLPPSDIDILDFLRKAGFTKEIKAIIGTSYFGKPTVVQRLTIVKALSHLIETIKNNPDILPYTYSYKMEIPRDSGKFSTGTFSTSGFRIGGILHSIEVGLNKCELSKHCKNKLGKWEELEPQDVRNLKIIELDKDNFFGDIIIYKKRKPTKLLSNLEQLRSFLLKTKVKTISKILS